jgi:hypothetical protein
MTRTIKSIPTGIDNEFKWEVTITGDECPPLTLAANSALRSLLRTCLDTQGLMVCGNNNPQTIKISHDGGKWVMVLEATGP